MRTINEVVVDVLANPEAYTDAFPVSGPVAEAGWSSYSREPRGMQWPPMTIDYMRRMLEERPLFPPDEAEQARQNLLRGAWIDGETRFVQDESHPRDRVTMVSMPLREDGAFQRMVNRERERRGFIRRTWESSRRPTVWEDEARAWMDQPGQFLPNDAPATGARAMANHAEERGRQLAEQAADRDYARRPDHYRVSPGRCHCGFTSMFEGDMDHHVRGIVHDCDGVPRRWWLCECGASALCREVVVAHRPSISFNMPLDPVALREEHIYLCTACCQRRGIR